MTRKVVTFQDWAPARSKLNHPESNRSFENHLSPNFHTRARCTLHSERRLTRLSAILKGDGSALIHADAESVLSVLAAEPIDVRLALIDPPYNRRTKFHLERPPRGCSVPSIREEHLEYAGKATKKNQDYKLASLMAEF
jgi:hypothetical protein